MSTFLGLDFGLRRIGVAVGQRITGTASPLKTLLAKDGVPDWQELRKLVKAWQPDGLVVGLPLNMDGTEAPITLRAREFMARLAAELKLPVYPIDERLTTRSVKDEFEWMGNKGPGKKDDALAACLIVRTYLNTPPTGR